MKLHWRPACWAGMRWSVVFGLSSAASLALAGSQSGSALHDLPSYWLFVPASGLLAAIILLATKKRHSEHSLDDLAEKINRIAISRDYGARVSDDYGRQFAKLSGALDGLLTQVEAQLAVLEQQVDQRSVELEKLASEYEHSSFHDALTGLPNQALLSEYFRMAAENAIRDKTSFCLLMLDMDNFKVINDTLGHDFGDELLKNVGARIKKAIRRNDMVFRLGGDEFAIVASGIRTDKDAEAVARQVSKAFKEDFVVRDERIKATVSIGGALYPEQGGDLVSMKRSADLAMYRAKESGKSRFQLYQSTMQVAAAQRMVVQNDLRSAIENGELIPYFQPKVDAARSQVVGCEVLVRWRHPKHGFLSPAEFIPFAEENGLIRVMDYYMLEQACQSAKSWYKDHGYTIPVAVNLSGAHFRDRQVVNVVAKALERSGLPPHLLEIELTEAVFISDPGIALATLNELKALGIRINLDDFGIGYSSLHYLRTLPVDVVKLDKSFIQNVTISGHDCQLTRGIISLASQLGFEVVAEGVETEAQMRQLLALDCHFMQGYYFCKPAPEEEFLDWVTNRDKHGFKVLQ